MTIVEKVADNSFQVAAEAPCLRTKRCSPLTKEHF